MNRASLCRRILLQRSPWQRGVHPPPPPCPPPTFGAGGDTQGRDAPPHQGPYFTLGDGGVKVLGCPILPPPCFAQGCRPPPPAKKQRGGGQRPPPPKSHPITRVTPHFARQWCNPFPAAGVTLVSLYPVYGGGGDRLGGVTRTDMGAHTPPEGPQFTPCNNRVQALGCPIVPPCFAQGPPPWLKSNEEEHEAEGVLGGHPNPPTRPKSHPITKATPHFAPPPPPALPWGAPSVSLYTEEGGTGRFFRPPPPRCRVPPPAGAVFTRRVQDVLAAPLSLSPTSLLPLSPPRPPFPPALGLHLSSSALLFNPFFFFSAKFGLFLLFSISFGFLQRCSWNSISVHPGGAGGGRTPNSLRSTSWGCGGEGWGGGLQWGAHMMPILAAPPPVQQRHPPPKWGAPSQPCQKKNLIKGGLGVAPAAFAPLSGGSQSRGGWGVNASRGGSEVPTAPPEEPGQAAAP